MPSLRRFFSIFFGAVAMLVVAGLCAFASLRLAIHGREVEVPNLSGRSDLEAASVAKDLGLNLSVENRFYSPAVAPNHVLSQSPAPGSRVRRGWQVRVTESLGGQQVAVPDVVGLTERPASLILRRLQLDVTTIAHLPAPSPAGIVLSQSPPPNSKGLNGPAVALLVSDEPSSAEVPSFVMPSILGMTLSSASLRLGSAGLHIASAETLEEATPTAAANPDGTFPDPAAGPAYVAPQVVSVNATIASQSPAPGHRVTRSEGIHVTLSH